MALMLSRRQGNWKKLDIKKHWTRPKDRVIGHVVWAPPISVHTTPHSYTMDVCVVKLDKKKFLQNFRGNVLDLGPEIDPGEFNSLVYPCIDAPSDFEYPVERLLKLRGILSAEEMRTPNNRDHRGDPMRYVIKRGITTLTTIGCLNGFESHVRRYFTIGSRDSVEAAVYPYDTDSGPFSRGDSGSIIVDALGKFVALLTGGTGSTDSFDITFGTPLLSPRTLSAIVLGAPLSIGWLCSIGKDALTIERLLNSSFLRVVLSYS